MKTPNISFLVLLVKLIRSRSGEALSPLNVAEGVLRMLRSRHPQWKETLNFTDSGWDTLRDEILSRIKYMVERSADSGVAQLNNELTIMPVTRFNLYFRNVVNNSILPDGTRAHPSDEDSQLTDHDIESLGRSILDAAIARTQRDPPNSPLSHRESEFAKTITCFEKSYLREAEECAMCILAPHCADTISKRLRSMR